MDAKMIGSRIADARKKINISQAGLAVQVFVSPQAVGKWERGESMPDIITLNHLTKILGVDLNYFSEGLQSTEEDTVIQKATDNNNIVEADKGLVGMSGPQEPQLLTNFNGSNLEKTDFAGVTAHNRKFNGSALRGCDFSGADLTGSSFKGSDVRAANFDATNLTDCTLFANDLTDSSFNKTILVRTVLSASTLEGAKFINAELVNVKLTKTDLTKTIFNGCVFERVDFDHSDLRGVCLDGQTFTNVKFHNGALNEVSFNGATLKNVSFRSTFALTNKYYRAIKTIRFEGASMDKLTYAALKSMGADLLKVTII